MEAAIWAVIGESIPYLAAVLMALYVVVAVYIALLDGLRVDRWAIFTKRGVMRGITAEDRTKI